MQQHWKPESFRVIKLTLKERAMETPTMNKKKGMTKSAKLQPFHGAWAIIGQSPPASSTRIINCYTQNSKFELKKLRVGNFAQVERSKKRTATVSPRKMSREASLGLFTARLLRVEAVSSSGTRRCWSLLISTLISAILNIQHWYTHTSLFLRFEVQNKVF